MNMEYLAREEEPMERPTYDGHHWYMEGETPFAKAFNKIQSEYWVMTGRCMEQVETVIQVLVDDYNKRNTL